MLSKFLPNEYVKSIFEIKPEQLKEKGIKGIITDLDNTLVAWNEANATEEVANWFQLMREHDFKITIVSNNNYERVKVFSEPLQLPFINNARKPLRRAFKRAQKTMKLRKDEVVVIGDQVMTDVLGGNSAGLYTILVVPIVETDEKITRFNRKMERIVLRKLKEQGKISWEE